jgi:hypothetical protein
MATPTRPANACVGCRWQRITGGAGSESGFAAERSFCQGARLLSFGRYIVHSRTELCLFSRNAALEKKLITAKARSLAIDMKGYQGATPIHHREGRREPDRMSTGCGLGGAVRSEGEVACPAAHLCHDFGAALNLAQP